MPPVGETIRVSGMPFEVVGVGVEKVQMSNYNRPDKYCVFIPWTTMASLGDTQYVSNFVFQAVSPTQEPKAIRQVRELLAERYRYNPRTSGRSTCSARRHARRSSAASSPA